MTPAELDLFAEARTEARKEELQLTRSLLALHATATTYGFRDKAPKLSRVSKMIVGKLAPKSYAGLEEMIAESHERVPLKVREEQLRIKAELELDREN